MRAICIVCAFAAGWNAAVTLRQEGDADRLVVMHDAIARWCNPRCGRDVCRVEQWNNAIRQGIQARLPADVSGREGYGAYQPVSWLWADQNVRKLKTGLYWQTHLGECTA